MKLNPLTLLLLLVTGLAMPTAQAQDSWEFNFALGGSVSKSQDLNFKDDSGTTTDTIHNANYKTKPFTAPPYYAMRLTRWKDNGEWAWEIEHIHQKIYVDDTKGTNVQHFEVTDGYNLFFANYARKWKDDMVWRMGIGPVVAHPQIKYKGVETYTKGGGAIPMIWDTSSGYQWAGLAAQVGLQKTWKIDADWSWNVEGKFTTAYANIDLDNGEVFVPNTAIHLLAGLTYHWQ